jgi:DNA-binding GntR family transcriptional regulator
MMEVAGKVEGSHPTSPLDEVTQRLEQAIVTGEFQPGVRLSEQMLCDTYGFGRGPLREAIRTLEGRRLVERTPYSGVKVIEMTLNDVEQLLVTREALEGMACRQAAECMTLHETRKLRECLSAYDKTTQEVGLREVFTHGTPEDDFHLQIIKGSRNRWLIEFLGKDLRALVRVARLQSSVVGHRVDEAADEHGAILEAIEKRAPDVAEALMRRHIANGREILLRQIRSAPAGGSNSDRHVTRGPVRS